MNAVLIAILTLIVGASSASAQTFFATNWLNVNPISASTFEVVLKPGASPRSVWCAASDYSGRRLGRYNKTELIVKSAVGPAVTQANRKGVVFTIDPSQVDVPPTKSYSVSIKKVGASMGVGHANGFCPFLPGPSYGNG